MWKSSGLSKQQQVVGIIIVIMAETKKLHIAFFPWLAFGHIIPHLEVALQIAQKGHKISFISTPRNIQRMPKIPTNLQPNINLVSLTLPQTENLPNHAESTMDLCSNEVPFLKIAYDSLQDPLTRFLKTSNPDWIVYDFAPYWLPSVAANLGIAGAFFSVYGSWTVTFLGSSSSSIINGDDQRTKAEDFTVPPKWIPFPSKVAFRLHEAKKSIDAHVHLTSTSDVSDMFRFGSVMSGCDVIAIRDCMELAGEFITLLSELHRKPVFPVGLLPPSAQDGGEDDTDTWFKIKTWLDKQNKGSVVYIAFGSESEPSRDEFKELALGLELSNLPFFWILRKQENDVAALLPAGYEERVKDQGVVWKSWAPQRKILAHDSVGGFLTHCGYSSIVEALYFERPLIMLTLSIDQGLIARVFAEKGVGVEIDRDDENGWFSKESVAESAKLVTVDEEGMVYRNNAKEMKKLVLDKEIHDRYIEDFVKFLVNYGLGRKHS
ncbi:putative UDP-rhamnose:rhamnosyltransferase 1 [Mercurialis annua]|uniref:putative UDP-rhamnose:rhamnosyltransferase 1 n=1 Tax=Mercurialis annua TaxID=3986 RepID=UPI00215FEF97|nr:putative UDP-rhamnose:rhamnosyltransferase 1 [Mercurialis annua]